MRSCDISALFIFMLVVWTIGIPSNAKEVNKKKYDSNSVEQNQKILRLLLRLAFYTANHLVHLKDAARVRAENEVDKDLHDITMNDIIQGVTMNLQNSNQSQVASRKSSADSDDLDIGTRFLPIGVQSFNTLIPINKIGDTMKNIASGNMSEISNIANNVQLLADEGAQVLQNVHNKSRNTFNETTGRIYDPDSLSNLTNIQDTAKKISPTSISKPIQSAELAPDVKSFNPLYRFLPNSDQGNSTNTISDNVNGSDKIEGRFDSIIQSLEPTSGTNIDNGHTNQTSSSTVIKRETSPVPVSLSTHARNQMSNDHITDGNFSNSKITDSSNDANVINGETALASNSLQSRMSTDRENGINCAEETPDIFQHILDDYDIEEDDFESDVVKLIGDMKLQDISNRLIDTLQTS